MLKGQKIKGYEVLQDFKTAGGGLSKWTFVKKNAKTYFMKEFLAPKYPTKDAPGSEKSKTKKRKACVKFEQHHKALMDEINERCGTGGNLVFTVDFFRHGSKYYKVTEKVNVASLTIKEIAQLSLEKKVLILRTISHSLSILHQAQIVHGDLKPDNILIKQTKTGNYTAKLIDFDNSYFSKKPPKMSEDVVGDMVFYSPELASYIQESTSDKAKGLTTKSDVFALGLLFVQYLTGKLPDFPQDKFGYPFMAVNMDYELRMGSKNIPLELEILVNQMLVKTAEYRPNIQEIFQVLKKINLPSFENPKNPKKSNISLQELKGILAQKREEPEEEVESKNLLSKLKGKGLNINKKK